jgi:hypothetical protein
MAGAVDDLPGVDVWFSPDGLDWREGVATLGDDSAELPELNSLVSTGAWVFAQLIIPGDAPGVADVPVGVWSSSDGTKWEEVDAVSDVFLAGAASSDATMVLAGTGAEGGAVFFVRN